MVDPVGTTRMHPLRNRRGASGDVGLTPAPPAARVSLRARADTLPDLGRTIGLELPTRPKAAVCDGQGRSALWLGPDEWLILDEADDAAGKIVADLAATGVLHSAVDISHRNTAIMVTGEGAETTLAAGCPQDLRLASFPIDTVSRTVLGKVEVIVWRLGEDMFRVECWRSYADYAFTFLADAARGNAA